MVGLKKIIFCFAVFTTIFSYSQEEKRLALVIGNANYEKGELKNPVNDARLIASTLDSLDFDVILKENLATKRDMTAAIREFGSKRSEYDVAFVYYAGHGIQVGDENFLLPTKEVFEEEFDVMDYGVSVQNIMRYLRAQTNEVNILILDACRDNPFESNWNSTRSLKGSGLAKIPPPTGSLIAFSTDSGQTAPDGEGDNSVYTISLAKNMLLEDTSIDQVFRNVRAEVLAQTDGLQRPVEATQLTGQTFYLNRKSMVNEIIWITDLYNNFKYDEALNLFQKNFNDENKINKKIAELHLSILYRMNKKEVLEIETKKYLKLFPDSEKINDIAANVFLEKARTEKKLEKAEEYYIIAKSHNEKSININPRNSDFYSTKTYISYTINNKENYSKFKRMAIENMQKIDSINLIEKNGNNFYNISYHKYLLDDIVGFNLNSIKSIQKNLSESHKIKKLVEWAEVFYISEDLRAEHDITKSFFFNEIYNEINNYAHLLFPKNYWFYANSITEDGSYNFENISKSLNLYPKNLLALKQRASYFYNKAYECVEEENENCNELAFKSIANLNYILEIDPNDKEALYILGGAYNFLIEDYEMAIKTLNKLHELTSRNPKSYSWLGQAYSANNEHFKSIESHKKSIEIYNNFKKYYIDDFNYLVATEKAHIYYSYKFLKQYKKAYVVLKEAYKLYPNRRNYDVIESAIFNNDLEFAISESRINYKKNNDKSFVILEAISHLKKGDIKHANKLFSGNIIDVNNAYEINKNARIKKALRYCVIFFMLQARYKDAIDYLLMEDKVYKEQSDESLDTKYLLAYSYFNSGNFLDAIINIEKVLLMKNDRENYQHEFDESFYLTLNDEKIDNLKQQIYSSIRKN